MFSGWILKTQQIWRDRDEEHGAIVMEYALLLILVLMVAVTALVVFGSGVLDLYTDGEQRYSSAIQQHLG